LVDCSGHERGVGTREQGQRGFLSGCCADCAVVDATAQDFGEPLVRRGGGDHGGAGASEPVVAGSQPLAYARVAGWDFEKQ